jgi:lipopolysaccharide export system permease protein
MILDRYVARTYVSTFGIVLLFVLSIFTVLTVILRIDSVLEARAGLTARGYSILGVLLRYCLVSLPFILLQFLPFVTLIAGSIAVVRLLRGNEIVPMIVAGRSPGRIAAPMCAFAGLMAVAMLAMQEWVAPRVGEARMHLESLMDGRFEGEFEKVPRIEDGAGNTWTVDVYSPLRKRLQGARVLRFRDPLNGREIGALDVRAADWRTGEQGAGFYPTDGVLIVGAAGSGLTKREPLPPDRPLPTDLTPDRIELELSQLSAASGASLSLTASAAKARDAGGDPRSIVAFHALLTWPIANVVLLLLGLPFLFRMGERNLLVGMGVALVLAAVYFAADHVFRDLGKRGSLPPVLASWMPVVLFVSLSAAVRDALRG